MFCSVKHTPCLLGTLMITIWNIIAGNIRYVAYKGSLPMKGCKHKQPPNKRRESYVRIFRLHVILYNRECPCGCGNFVKRRYDRVPSRRHLIITYIHSLQHLWLNYYIHMEIGSSKYCWLRSLRERLNYSKASKKIDPCSIASWYSVFEI